MRTIPDELVDEPYEETAMYSIVTGRLSARAKSAITIAAPLSTPTRTGSRSA